MRHTPVALLLLIVGCSPGASENTAPIPPVALPAELEQVLRGYESAYQRRDSSALAGLFTPDGMLLPVGKPVIRGQAAVGRELSREGGALTLVPIAYGLADSVAYITGTFGAERSATAGGKFVLALQRSSSGEWRVAADIANPNKP